MEKKLKYNSFIEWRKAEPLAYQAAKNRGMVDKICEEAGWAYPKRIIRLKTYEELLISAKGNIEE